ncbi:hypothetical protein GE09DRAFT_606697 [Coniochaeta sp. 2T2.1]|nr:hypothetical protein GE09DRAFT_606697 [Coniochaeta sp. 2T2.1]
MSLTKEPSGVFTAKQFLPVPDDAIRGLIYCGCSVLYRDSPAPGVHAYIVSCAGLPSSGPAFSTQYQAVLCAWEGVAARSGSLALSPGMLLLGLVQAHNVSRGSTSGIESVYDAGINTGTRGVSVMLYVHNLHWIVLLALCGERPWKSGPREKKMSNTSQCCQTWSRLRLRHMSGRPTRLYEPSTSGRSKCFLHQASMKYRLTHLNIPMNQGLPI